MPLITKELVKKGIEIARPSIIAMLETEGATWGPKWVSVAVHAPGINYVLETVGEVTEWQDAWGEKKDFEILAISKMEVSSRTGMPTNRVANECPWRLDYGEYLYAGGVIENDIAVGVSGACGLVDEGIAWIILNSIATLAQIEKLKLQNQKINQIS